MSLLKRICEFIFNYRWLYCKWVFRALGRTCTNLLSNSDGLVSFAFQEWLQCDACLHPNKHAFHTRELLRISCEWTSWQRSHSYNIVCKLNVSTWAAVEALFILFADSFYSICLITTLHWMKMKTACHTHRFAQVSNAYCSKCGKEKGVLFVVLWKFTCPNLKSVYSTHTMIKNCGVQFPHKLWE